MENRKPTQRLASLSSTASTTAGSKKASRFQFKPTVPTARLDPSTTSTSAQEQTPQERKSRDRRPPLKRNQPQQVTGIFSQGLGAVGSSGSFGGSSSSKAASIGRVSVVSASTSGLVAPSFSSFDYNDMPPPSDSHHAVNINRTLRADVDMLPVEISKDRELPEPAKVESGFMDIGQFALFQFPPLLPRFESSSCSAGSPSKNSNSMDVDDNIATPALVNTKRKPQGRVGELIFYKSGRRVVRFGDEVEYEMMSGVECAFRQSAAVVDTSGSMFICGDLVGHKFVCTNRS